MADRWRQVEDFFHRALEREEPERAAFLNEACAGDDALRREVEALLAEETESGFMETPAMEGEARELAQENRPTMEGKRIGNFEILSLLGKGGRHLSWAVNCTILANPLYSNNFHPARCLSFRGAVHDDDDELTCLDSRDRRMMTNTSLG